MIGLFTRHPREMNESYIQHFICSAKFGLKMLVGSVFCLIHAVFPFVFKRTGSGILFSMMHDYVARASATEDRVVRLSQKLYEKSIPS